MSGTAKVVSKVPKRGFLSSPKGIPTGLVDPPKVVLGVMPKLCLDGAFLNELPYLLREYFKRFPLGMEPSHEAIREKKLVIKYSPYSDEE